MSYAFSGHILYIDIDWEQRKIKKKDEYILINIIYID
jgi:hypothetical protein